MKKIILALLSLLAGQASPCLSQSLPIKPARAISFTTDEGSYMDVDVSPDGRTIVFDILGDLYTVPIEGGSAKQLTRGLAYNRCPVWSPNGKQIAFIGDPSGANRLEVIDANGTGERTLDLAQPDLIGYDDIKLQAIPAWTPDGQYVAAGNQLYAFAGGSMKLPFGIKYNVQFSKDGRFLYADQDGKKIEEVERYDRRTGAKTKLAEIPVPHTLISEGFRGWNENQIISPDGKWLAYIDDSRDPESDLRLRNLVTGDDRLLAAAVEGHHRLFVEHFCFAPDSRSLIIGFGGKLHQIGVKTGIDHIIPFKAEVNADLGAFNYNTFKINDSDSLQVRLTHSANASPNGKDLVFTALDRIYVMKLPDGKPLPLVKQPIGQFQPVYSPDGNWIAYVTWSDTQGGYLWRVPASGGEPERLTALSGWYAKPTWSPDGREVAVTRGNFPLIGNWFSSAVGDLELIDVQKKTVQKVADSILLTRSCISFTADSASIMAIKYTGPNYQDPKLFSFSLNGRQNVVLAAPGTQPLAYAGTIGMKDVSISPDQRFVIYSVNDELYLAPMPGLGVPAMLNSRSGIKPVVRFTTGGYDPHWEKGGKVLSWSYADYYYRIDPDKIMESAIAVAKENAAKGIPDTGFYKLSVVPDQTVMINLKAAKNYGKGTLALRNVRIIPMRGGVVIEKGTIVITDGRIITVGAVKRIAIPADAKVYDLGGKTVMPGLIDLHDHMAEPNEIFPQQSWKYLANLAYGVTTARNPAAGSDEFGYAELLQTGQMTGPRLFSVGYAVGEAGNLKVNSLQDAEEFMLQHKELAATVIKQYLQDTRLQRQWVLMACREAGLNMTNEGDYDPREELAMIKDGSTGVEHAYGWGNVYNDVIRFIAESGTWHTPTLIVANHGAERYFQNYYREHPDKKLGRFWPEDYWQPAMKTPGNHPDTIKSNFVYTSSVEAKIYHQGGHIGLGGHGNDAGIISQWELWALQMGGLTNLEALKIATISGAEALGMQQDLGSIEPGKIADLIILDKNPLEDIHNTMSIHYVMKDGILYNGSTLDELWPELKKCPQWQLDPKYLTNKRQ